MIVILIFAPYNKLGQEKRRYVIDESFIQKIVFDIKVEQYLLSSYVIKNDVMYHKFLSSQ